jgi:hypothetical protein
MGVNFHWSLDSRKYRLVFEGLRSVRKEGIMIKKAGSHVFNATQISHEYTPSELLFIGETRLGHRQK